MAFLFFFGCLFGRVAAQPSLPLPTAAQLAWQQNEIMALVHFNMASFFRDGDPGCGSDNWLGENGSSNPDSFAPSALNVSQWVDSMVAIKVSEAVLTAKHGAKITPPTHTQRPSATENAAP